jgi:hypothetical protein
MIRLALIAAAFVALTGAQCSKAEIERYSALVAGTADPSRAMAFMVEEVALEMEVVKAEPVVIEPPEPPPCVDYLNRGVWYDCHGNWLRDL